MKANVSLEERDMKMSENPKKPDQETLVRLFAKALKRFLQRPLVLKVLMYLLHVIVKYWGFEIDDLPNPRVDKNDT